MAEGIKPNHIGDWRTSATGHVAKDANGDDKTDYSRWRLVDNDGCLRWRYLDSDEEVAKWPQTIYDKHHLGLPTVSKVIPAHMLVFEPNIELWSRDILNCHPQRLPFKQPRME
jgi:lanosterol synthase